MICKLTPCLYFMNDEFTKYNNYYSHCGLGLILLTIFNISSIHNYKLLCTSNIWLFASLVGLAMVPISKFEYFVGTNLVTCFGLMINFKKITVPGIFPCVKWKVFPAHTVWLKGVMSPTV